MKKIKLTMIIVVFATIISCNKNEIKLDETKVKQDTEQQFVDGVIVKNGTLYFESGDNFFETIDSLQRMSDSEFNALANKAGFNSYRTKLCDDQTKRTEEINKWVDSMMQVNPDALANANPYLDEYIEPTIKSSLYRSIVNEDGVFYVEGIKNAVNETHVSAYSTVKTKANTTEETLISKTQYVENVKTKALNWDSDNVAFSCNKRQMQVLATHHVIVYQGNNKESKCYIEITSKTMKKGLFGWGVYNTTHNFYNLNIGNRYFASGFTREGKIVYTTFDYLDMTADFVVNANVQFHFTSTGTAEHGVGYYDKKSPVKVQHVNAC